MTVGDVVRRLESTDETGVLGELQKLSDHKEISADEAKQLGPVINKIRKNGNMQEASALATALLTEWKPLLTSKPKPNETNKLGPKRDVQSTTHSREPTRLKSVDLFLSALSAPNQDLAEFIEEAVFDEFGSVDAGYRAKVRSKYLNLKQNASLRSQLESGAITAGRFVEMSPQEMASAEVREADAAAAAKALRDTQAAIDTEAETDQFRCGRCGKRRCKYYQLQTRSADEPMTTFVTCVNCGNRWKFS